MGAPAPQPAAPQPALAQDAGGAQRSQPHVSGQVINILIISTHQMILVTKKTPKNINCTTLKVVPLPPRHYFGHLSLPQDHYDGGHYGYLSSSPIDTVDMSHQVTEYSQTWIDPGALCPFPPSRFLFIQDPEASGRRAKGQNCLLGCCNINLDEPKGYHSQVTRPRCCHSSARTSLVQK